ncbi:MAG: pyridoxamine 5'-phosphate oxidase family protein [Ginsengibacter sp.]
MDSINQNQQEENHQDLSAAEAIKKIKELVEKAKTCFFCTRSSTTQPKAARPMSVQKIDKDGNLWFLSANDSHKNSEIQTESLVDLYFQGSAHSDFLHLIGNATISQNKEKIKELWEPILKTWFTEGENDPRISVIKVAPNDGYYWDNKHGNVVAGVKILIGAAIGKTMDDSIEGKLDL